jgi:UTP--glucose-1-phosphate uridylyltransferase
MVIRKAVIPAAGLGTRFLPVTKAQPKEMLPVVNKPVIQYVVEEAYHAGVHQMLLITGKHKRAIEDHLDRATINTNENPDFLKLEKILDEISLYYVRQKVQAGLGDAIRYAKDFVDDDFFAVLLGDNITCPNCTRDLIRAHKKYHAPILAIETVSQEKIRNHGVILGSKQESGVYKIQEMFEKPDKPVSNLAIIGRYILSPDIFDYLSATKKGYGGEIQLTDALQEMVCDGKEMYAVLHQGRRFDVGNIMDWMKANIVLGMDDKEIGEDLREFIGAYMGGSSD